MKKRRFIKFSSLTVGLAIIGMLLFSLPLMGAAGSAQSSDQVAVAVEETSNETDIDATQDEVEEVGGADEANEASDANEADENLPGGGHEDQDGVETEHDFEGVE